MSRARWESLRWASRALEREAFGFTFEYPIEIVPAAGDPGSLRYYVFSDSLFLENQDFDDSGIPRKRYRVQGPQYNPLFIAWWGLHHLERYARWNQVTDRDIFLTQVRWLTEHAVIRPDRAAAWPCNFPWQEGRAFLPAPWISAMYQGVVISTLLRAFRLTRDSALLELARSGSRVFDLDIGAGGVRTHENGYILYEEYPAFPLPRVLDGFLFSLLGLYDLASETGDPHVLRLFEDGVNGLVHHLSWWNYRGKWSWYGSHGYLCPPHYHALNRALLEVLYELTGRQALKDMAASWGPTRLSWAGRIEVFLAFLLTKNLARIRLRRRNGSGLLPAGTKTESEQRGCVA